MRLPGNAGRREYQPDAPARACVYLAGNLKAAVYHPGMMRLAIDVA
jgi:hypothetical protein